MTLLSDTTALIIVDVQDGLDDPGWGRRNNPDAESNIARLLTAWRTRGRPIYHVQHMSTNPNSPLRPDQPGNAIKRIVAPQVDLAADPKFRDERSIALNVVAAEVIEQAPPTPDQHQQAAPRVMILFMGLQVLGQVLNALGEQSDLHLSRPRVGVVAAVLSDRCRFVRHARNSFPR